MGSRLGEFADSQKEVVERSRFKVSSYQNEIDKRDDEVNRLKAMLSNKEDNLKVVSVEQQNQSQRSKDLEDEVEFKNGEINRLRA